MGTHRQYDRSFKERAVKMSYERDNIKTLASELGITAERIYKWRREFTEHGEASFQGRDAIIERIEREDNEGFVDYITLSASILFSAKSVTSIEELRKQGLYNRIRLSNYTADSYLDGIEIVSCGYKELFEKYKDNLNVVFLVDPPYLNTDVGTYTMSWKLGDYLDVLTVLKDSAYVYFTSNKSDIIELCEWIGENKVTENPFRDASKVEFRASVNYNSRYIDIMLYKQYA